LLKVFEVFEYHAQYLKVFKYLIQYSVFKYYLNTPKCEVFHKVFKYSGQSICYNTAQTVPAPANAKLHTLLMLTSST